MGSNTSKLPVHLEVKKIIQQLRAIPIEETEKRDQKLGNIESQLQEKSLRKSSKFEAIFHDLFDLFYELYQKNEFDDESGSAFYLFEIIHGLKHSHPNIDFPKILKQSLKTFAGQNAQQKKVIKELARRLVKEWAYIKNLSLNFNRDGSSLQSR
jgi:regulator of RNase E activity RraB